MNVASPNFTYAKALKKLEEVGQQHLLHFWSTISLEEQKHLLKQIDQIDLDTYFQQKKLFLSKHKLHKNPFEPFQDFHKAGSTENFDLGSQLIASGKVGCVIVAGGQGTRLRFQGPKGMFPITPLKHKTLFQLFAEKTIAASKLAKRPLKLAIMTSDQNHDETIAYFKQNNLFGLQSEQLSFFTQKSLPLLDNQGNFFLDSPYAVSSGPDGNGSCLPNFVKSQICEEWNKSGIEYLNLILIDNALSDPFPNEMIGFHAITGSQITVKCVEKESADEKVGVLVKGKKGVQVVEYSEMSKDERAASAADGHLKHRCANISSFCWDMSFIKEGVKQHTLSWHIAHKAVPCINEAGEVITPHEPNAWKYEQYIFDWLPFATSVRALLFPRRDCFAPLKNGHGDASRESVQQALIQRDIAILEKMTGRKVKAKKIELAQDFYYPSKQLIDHWHGKMVEKDGYIEKDLDSELKL